MMEYPLSSVCFLNITMVFYTRITEKKKRKKLGERIDVYLQLFYTETGTSRRVSRKTFVLVAIDGFVWPSLNIFTSQTRDIGEIERVHGD